MIGVYAQGRVSLQDSLEPLKAPQPLSIEDIQEIEIDLNENLMHMEEHTDRMEEKIDRVEEAFQKVPTINNDAPLSTLGTRKLKRAIDASKEAFKNPESLVTTFE